MTGVWVWGLCWGLTGVPALVGAAQAALAVPDGAGAGGVAGLREEPQGLHVLEVWGQTDVRGDRRTAEGTEGQHRDPSPAQDTPNFRLKLRG